MPGQNQCIRERLPDVLKWWLSRFRTAYNSLKLLSIVMSNQLAMKIIWDTRGWFKSKRGLYCFGVYSSLVFKKFANTNYFIRTDLGYCVWKTYYFISWPRDRFLSLYEVSSQELVKLLRFKKHLHRTFMKRCLPRKRAKCWCFWMVASLGTF